MPKWKLIEKQHQHQISAVLMAQTKRSYHKRFWLKPADKILNNEDFYN